MGCDKNTPSMANWLLSKVVRDQLHEEFLGDLEEVYKERLTTRMHYLNGKIIIQNLKSLTNTNK